ncbi:unnamed protein product [Allacma fusca]|uniref:G-protein coupled receptors family 2 profile 1 domain-containing protein n=1 Tax=Allacma fusca TaxID=39272 RepID=A0A8J2LCB6_9HEXA|nr:unnamed protein product [Allacma fusca]
METEDTSLNQTEVEAVLSAAEIECYNASAPSNRSGLMCPRIWDSWVCWDETPAGTNALAPCPDHVIGFDPNRMAYKECLPDGSWFRHPESNRTWSNYTTCVDQADLARRQAVNTIYEIGYLISLCALIISLVIFCSFRYP